MKPSTPVARDRELVPVVLVCDNVVRLFVCQLLPENHARVFVSKEAGFSKRHDVGEREYYSLISSAIYKLLHDAEATLRKNNIVHARMRRVVFYYAPPLSQFGTEKITLVNPKRATLTESALEAAVVEAEKRFMASQKVLNQNVATPAKLAVVERRFLQTRIDGYEVSDFISRDYREFTAYLMLRSIPEKLAEKLSEITGSVFPSARPEHRLADSAIFHALSRMTGIPDSFDYVVVLPSRAFVVSVKGGSPMRRALFDGGYEHTLTMFSRGLSATRSVAQSYAAMYLENKLHGAGEAHFTKALEAVRGLWFKSFAEAQQELQSDFLLSSRTYALSWGSVDGLIMGGAAAESDTPTLVRGMELIPAERFLILETEDRISAGPVPSILMLDALTYDR